MYICIYIGICKYIYTYIYLYIYHIDRASEMGALGAVGLPRLGG